MGKKLREAKKSLVTNKEFYVNTPDMYLVTGDLPAYWGLETLGMCLRQYAAHPIPTSGAQIMSSERFQSIDNEVPVPQ